MHYRPSLINIMIKMLPLRVEMLLYTLTRSELKPLDYFKRWNYATMLSVSSDALNSIRQYVHRFTSLRIYFLVISIVDYRLHIGGFNVFFWDRQLKISIQSHRLRFTEIYQRLAVHRFLVYGLVGNLVFVKLRNIYGEKWGWWTNPWRKAFSKVIVLSEVWELVHCRERQRFFLSQ